MSTELVKKSKDATEEIVDLQNLIYYCDKWRHLVCLPFSVENLHRMADDLKIGRHWFHRNASYPHYDIPVRRFAAISARCRVVDGRPILAIVKGQLTVLAEGASK